MKVRELKAAIDQMDDDLEVLVRCQWDDDAPNGNCFNLASVVVDCGCTDMDMAVLDCDQEFDLEDSNASE